MHYPAEKMVKDTLKMLRLRGRCLLMLHLAVFTLSYSMCPQVNVSKIEATKQNTFAFLSHLSIEAVQTRRSPT